MKRKTTLTKSANNLDDDLFVSRTIVRLSELGSFSAAARTLGVSVSAITRAVQRTEQRLGAALFLRSTHGVSTTAAGRSYAAHLQHWLIEEERMRRSLCAEQRAERGYLRVTMPVFIAEQLLSTIVCSFQRAFPHVYLEVHASDDVRDIIKEGFDLAIRLGPLSDSSLRVRTLATFQQLLVAAPSFLSERTRPKKPSHVSELPCLLYRNLGAGSEEKWSFWTAQGELISVPVTGMIRSNNTILLRDLALAGLGLARLPEAAVSEAILAGSLVQLLPAFQCSPPDGRPTLYAVHAKDPGKDRLRNAFISMMKDQAAQIQDVPRS